MCLPKIIFENEDIDKHKNYGLAKIAALKNFRDMDFGTDPTQWQYLYLDKLINDISNIVTLDSLDILRTEFDNIHKFENLKCRCKNGSVAVCSSCSDRTFSLRLQTILGYEHDRLVSYFLYNANKTCYICNAQYTVVAQKDYENNYKGRYKFKSKYIKSKRNHVSQGRNKAKFQLDHYYPKSLYPAFSVSLGNLYPICGSCNQVKSNSNLDIAKMHSNFKFELEEISIYKFYRSKKITDLKFHIHDFGTDGILDKFDLKGIYDNHVDHAEELLLRKIYYSDSYKTALLNKHPDITPTFTSIEDRLIVGTYDKSEGIYKRPLSKMLQDLNDQLDDFVK